MGVPAYLRTMFVRRKPNKSGKTSVQVVEKTRDRKQRVVKTIGCSADEDAIKRMVAEAHDFIDSQLGPMLPGFDEEE